MLKQLRKMKKGERFNKRVKHITYEAVYVSGEYAILRIIWEDRIGHCIIETGKALDRSYSMVEKEPDWLYECVDKNDAISFKSINIIDNIYSSVELKEKRYSMCKYK